jgi:AbrB family looped-hinge helix DNA binding protein
MKNESTILVKGQTTVPAEIRKRFGCAPGTRLDWHVLEGGRLVVRVMTSNRTVKKS